MFGFGRKKKNEDAEVQETAVEQAQAEINDDPDMRADDTAAPTAVAEERTEFDRANGPYDTDEKSENRMRVKEKFVPHASTIKH